MGVITEQSKGMDVSDEDQKFIADIYKYSFVGLMLDWIKHDMKEDPKQIIDRLDLVIHGNFKKALEAFARNRTD